MASFKQIHLALDAKLNDYTDAEDLDVAWENVKFNPTGKDIWLRPTLLPISSELLNFESDQNNPGIYQIDIFVPTNKGIATLLDIVDDLYDHFIATDLTSGSEVVHVTTINRGLIVRQDNFCSCFIEVNFISYSS